MIAHPTPRVSDSAIISRFASIIVIVLAIFAGSPMQSGLAFAQPSTDVDIDIHREKKALVIGNGKYTRSPLANPTNDARDIALSLRSIGFDVTLATDLDYVSMQTVISRFIAELADTAAAVVFFAGHGVQHDGQNFLLPTDALDEIKSAQDLVAHSISLSRLLNDLTLRKDGLSIVVLDACRDSPFEPTLNITGGLARSVAPLGNDGSARRKPAANAISGALIAYSTSPNTAAADGEGETNSPYSAHLKRELKRPNASIETILKFTRSGVTAATNGRQTPWYESSINGNFYPAGRGRIDFEELLKLLVAAPTGDGKNGFELDWEIGSTDYSSIKWRHERTIEAPDGIKVPEFTGPELGQYKREGDVVITMNGSPSHYSVLKKKEPVVWMVTLIGSRWGVRGASFTNEQLTFEFKGFGGVSVLEEEKTCRKGEPDSSEGTRMYKVNLPNRLATWLAEEVTCGTGGCNYSYYLLYNKSDRAHFGCK